MNKCLISLVVFVAPVVQSCIAVANASLPHQLDKTHLQTVHSHQQDSTPQSDIADGYNSQHNIQDCHHCGHCQGNHANSAILVSATLNSSPIKQGKSPGFSQFIPEYIPDNLLRPPIKNSQSV
ncbi:hypothetical protein [Neptunicella marina]|uniref:DUF2946 domain-containing protein n=1 Tax=Neptunicella marina TaxID=2125989 RepID=A0A8J6M066_9ALTE|nr:hypothetical protein [Neptunicella marina]MBC3764318.1 hypothetical protein [Neptunicella marina]